MSDDGKVHMDNIDGFGAKPMAPHVHVAGLKKRFEGKEVYASLDLEVGRGEVVSVFGPNGCGKSTLIGIMAGIIAGDGGTVSYGGLSVQHVRIGYVFQNYRDALFPWMRALDNIRYPLEFAGVAPSERDRRVDEIVSLFDVGFDLKLYPHQLSGGQQQLISIMRALVVDPQVLFLDEPFSALDYEMTLFVRDQLQEVLHLSSMSTILVSHDLEEAIYLADRVVLLSKRPSHIAEIVPVPLSWPRDPEIFADESFVKIKAHCFDIFRREVRR
ncbi:MAG: ABC transporter ATP-binding protein [Pseudorhodoplanes sp.]